MINISFDNPYLLLIAIPVVLGLIISYLIVRNKDNKSFPWLLSLVFHIAITVVVTLAIAGLSRTTLLTETTIYVVADVSHSSERSLDKIDEYIEENSPNVQPNLLHGLDDYDRWKRVSDMRNRNRSQSRFLKENLMRNIQERSNGESALSYFVDSIQENALYLLDEPENSLSPQNQLQLKYFIEDSVRNFGCQFVISTHSPFLLSLRGAHIYNIDETPPAEKKWTELDCVKVYHDFFIEQNDKFH